LDPTYLASFGTVESSHWWFRARREIILDQMRLHAPRPAMGLLDVGTGTGGNLLYFQEELPQTACAGIDPDPTARLFCDRLGLDVREGTAEHLALPDGSVDIVTAIDVLEHVEDDRRAASEMARVLRPGGLAVVAVPAYMWMWGPHDELNQHKRRYVRSQAEELLTVAGLGVVRSTYYNTLLLPGAALVKTKERLSRTHTAEERIPSRPVNWVLYRVFWSERHLLRHFTLPFGGSILVLARKPGEP
jgi:SAM-dependent methyltransferase